MTWQDDTDQEELVEVNTIVTHPDFQMRERLDPRTAATYAADLRRGANFPPVRLARINGVLYVVDGFHRLEAHKINGTPRIRATVQDASETDAIGMAAEANLTHGVVLKTRELRNVLTALIRAGRHRRKARLLSYREIAGLLANRASHTTVRRWIKADHPKLFAAMGGADASPRQDAGPPPVVAPLTPLEVVRSHVVEVAAITEGLTPNDRAAVGEMLKRLDAWVSEGDGPNPWTQAAEPNDGNPDF